MMIDKNEGSNGYVSQNGKFEYTQDTKEQTPEEKAYHDDIATRSMIIKITTKKRDAWKKEHPNEPLPKEGREFGEAISKYLSYIPMVPDIRTKIDGISAAIQDLGTVAEIRMDPELKVKCYVLTREWEVINAGFIELIPETWPDTQYRIHKIVAFAKTIVYTWSPPICTKLVSFDLLAQSTTMNQE